MDAFRNMVRGWLGRFFLVLISIPFVFFGVETYFGGGAEPSVAEVAGEPITQRLLIALWKISANSLWRA